MKQYTDKQAKSIVENAEAYLMLDKYIDKLQDKAYVYCEIADDVIYKETPLIAAKNKEMNNIVSLVAMAYRINISDFIAVINHLESYGYISAMNWVKSWDKISA